MKPHLFWLLALVAPSASAAAAAEEEPAGARARATRRAEAISIDGRIDDAGWAGIPTSSGFIQRSPDEGKPPTNQTEFKVVYDDSAIYIAVRCFDGHPDRVRGLLTRRDALSASDWVLVGLDSYHDRRTAFIFAVNPAGVERDFLIFNNAEQDDSWDAVWSAAAAIVEQGWVAEMRIPLSQLRFSGAPDQNWGLQVIRREAHSGEETTWSPWPRSGNQVVSVFGTLDEIKDLKPGRRVEVLPYASTGVALAADDPMNPFDASADGRINAGLDVKYGLSSAFTLAASINPDFGQVEADPSQVNLTGRQTFFPEKRPFFLEGNDLFRYSLQQGDSSGNQGEGLFYTRRIGAPPHLSGDDYASYSDTPDATVIYGAAKVSGKTASGWSVGLLEAITGRETASLSDDQPDLVVEPLTNYAMVRVHKDLRGGLTTIAGAITAVDRKLEGDEVKALLHDQAYTGGLEATHRFADDQWGTTWKLYGSWVHGSEDALLEDQTSIYRLYQRPDRFRLDPTRTSLAGTGLQWDIGRWNHKSLNFGTGGDIRSPGLEVNDMGFQNSADQITQWGWLGYRHDEPSEHILSWQVNLNLWALADWEPRPAGYGGNVNYNVMLADYWGFGAGINVDRGLWNTAGLRGGPRLNAENAWNAWFDVGTDSRKKVWANLGTNVVRRGESDSWQSGLSGAITVQARSNVELSLGPTIQVVYEDHQYVDQVPDTTGETAYVFARIHQVVTAMTVRAAWTFTPRMSVQFYAQPFIATGAYDEYKEAGDTYSDDYCERFVNYDEAGVDEMDDVILIDRDADGTADVAVGKPDFNVREVRSTLVGRWEYRPGSTVYLIWSHNSSSDEVQGNYHLVHDLTALTRERGEDVVMVKVNYWVGL
jgi:hypothetical protein